MSTAMSLDPLNAGTAGPAPDLANEVLPPRRGTDAPTMHIPAQPNVIFNDSVPHEVTASLTDKGRLCPVMSGAAWLQGDRLTVRTATRDVEVRAPKALLAQVHALCDGTRTVLEVLDHAPASHVVELRDFVLFLLEQGALVDASLLTLQAAAYAHQGSPFGVVAPSRVSNQLCRRFLWNVSDTPDELRAGIRAVPRAPLSAFFDARVSTYTFDDRPVREAALLQLAWSIAGVVRTEHERVGLVAPKRTLPSAGGMHLLQVFVALQRPVGSCAAGVYRVTYPAERAVRLDRVGGEDGLLPRAFSKPWELGCATGAVFIAADAQAAAMRYRNRAVQYLFMEAGAALHNAGLTAPQLGAGFAIIGGYHEDLVANLCGLDRELVLGAGIFGSTPTCEQVRQSQRALDLEFAWVNGNSGRYSMPFHLASARVRTPDDDRPHTWGRDTDPRMAYVKAAAEAVEREGFREPRGLSVGRLQDVAGAIDPRTMVSYSRAQHARAGFAFAPFDEAAEYCWTRAKDLLSGEPVHVLAELVFSRASLATQVHSMHRPCTQVTSSGCAAGASFEDAAGRAMLEVVERDAFMRHWLRQSAGQEIPAETLPPGVQERLDALRAAGCRVSVQRLESRWAHVGLVAAQSAHLHFTTMGTSAHADLGQALIGALQETEARVYAWLHGHRPGIDEPEKVSTPEHHFELYGSPRHFRRADRVLFPAKVATGAAPEASSDGSMQTLLQRLTRDGLRPIVVDITPANASIDQGRTSLRAVKALIPGLLPMSFGFGREPLGMVGRIHPAAAFPHPFP